MPAPAAPQQRIEAARTVAVGHFHFISAMDLDAAFASASTASGAAPAASAPPVATRRAAETMASHAALGNAVATSEASTAAGAPAEGVERGARAQDHVGNGQDHGGHRGGQHPGRRDEQGQLVAGGRPDARHC